MLSIGTNLSAYTARKSLENSTSLLNQAIERMSTGFKINHSKDNAANYAITERMTTQISSLDIAEDNTATGLDLVTTANEQLNLINDRFTRLRNLAVQAENCTYGDDSLKAINAECEALVDEIKRIYNESEYNGIKLYGEEYFETVTTNSTQTFSLDPTPQTVNSEYATESTTLQELGIGSSSFQIYNSNGGLIESYDTEKTDTLADIFNVLNNYGFTSSINEGVVSITSSNGRYVTGELMQELGINLDSTEFVSSSSQNSESKIYYTTTMTATEATTLAELEVITNGKDTVKIKDKYGDNVASIEVDANTTLGGLFNALGDYEIQGSINDGVISLTSSNGNYVLSEGVIASLGIGTAESSSAVTTGTSQTSADVVTYEMVNVSGGEVTTIQEERTVTIWTTTTTSETLTVTTLTSSTEMTITTNTLLLVTTITPTYSEEEVAAMTNIQAVTTFITGQTYKIETTEDLLYLANKVNSYTNTTGVIFVLANDIDLSSISNWTPIGKFSTNQSYHFKGIFNGNGKTISNLTINNETNSGQGLFGYTAVGSEIKNVTLENVNIIGTNYTGGLVGKSSSLIDNCNINGSVTGTDHVGGLVGYASTNSLISNSYAIGTVSGDTYIGGLVGYATYTTINCCNTTSTINGNEFIGGLLGSAASDVMINQSCTNSTVSGLDSIGGLVGYASTSSLISNSYAIGTVSGDTYIGGLVGYCTYVSIDKSFVYSNNIVGTDYVGGLVGCASGFTTVNNCYTTAIVSGTNYVGGLIGYANSSSLITNSYAIGTANGNINLGGFVGQALNGTTISNCAATQADLYATQKTTEEILNTYTFDYMGFTDDNNWLIINGYDHPILNWEKETNLVTLDTTLEELGFNDDVYLCFDNVESKTNENTNKGLLCETDLDGDVAWGVMNTVTLNDFIELLNGSVYSNQSNTFLQIEFKNGTLIFTSPIGSSIDTDTLLGDVYGTPNFNGYNFFSLINGNVTEQSVSYSMETINTIFQTTTSSVTETETVNITHTAEILYTTSNISITSANTFSELELTSRGYITVMNDSTRTIITVKTADTVNTIMKELDKSGITATLIDGKLSLTPDSKKVYISGMSDNLIDALKFNSDFYTTSLGVDMTESNIHIYDGITTIKKDTTFSEIGITSGELTIKKDNEDYDTISIDNSDSLDNFVKDLNRRGFNAKLSNGALLINADGDIKLSESLSNTSNAISLLKLENVVQEINSTYTNTDSSQLEKVNEVINTAWKATGSIKLQVGINSDDNNQIEINTGFTLENIDKFYNIGKNTVNKTDYLKELDNVLTIISEKQTSLGASENRLESALEEISIRYDNLVSARSTLKDADIAEESSLYIQQQILQQASATLLSTANLNPQLALQLL